MRKTIFKSKTAANTSLLQSCRIYRRHTTMIRVGLPLHHNENPAPLRIAAT